VPASLAMSKAFYLPRCNKCDKEFEKLEVVCERCREAFYCSKECQTKAWKNHQNICKLARCHECDKEPDKLLCCGRCKSAFYCSRECQNNAWKNHKKNCRRPITVDEKAQLLEEPKPIKKKEVRPEAKNPAPAVVEEEEENDDEDSVQTAAQFRQELLSLTQVTNSKMVQAMQESKGDPAKFLPQVVELKDEYHRMILDHVRVRNCSLSAPGKRKADAEFLAAFSDDGDQLPAAVAFGRSLMKEVIMALLKRGLSASACVDQLDLANNHFNAGIVSPRTPSDFALEDGDLDGFEPAATKVRENGFVSVHGLLDEEMGAIIHGECKEKYWDCRDAGCMRPSAGAAVDGYECWLPYPPRKGTSPELEHALRVIFGLPHEIQRHGYPVRLKVPTMAHLSCFLPGSGREALHLDNHNPASGGRELTFVLFLSPQWTEKHGGSFRAYMQPDEDSPGPRPASLTQSEEPGAGLASQKEHSQPAANAQEEPARDKGEQAVLADVDREAEENQEERAERFKDFEPEAGQCLIFRSRELWHELLVAKRLQFALTLFVQCAD